MAKKPKLNRLTPLQRAQMGNLPTRGLPDMPPGMQPPSPPPPPVVTAGDNLRQAGREMGAVALNTLGLAPLGVSPWGTAVNTGQFLGNTAVVGMNLYERERERRQGTPQERAERAYGEGIEAKIRRGQLAQNGRKYR